MERRTDVRDGQTRGLLVGQAAALVGVSVKAIRTYHAHGVLPEPDRDESGYRRHGAEDLLALARVVRLRRIGLSLREIAPLVSGDDRTTAEGVRERLAALDRRLENEMAALKLRRELIAQLLAEGVDDPVAVSPTQLWEERAVAFLRSAVPNLTAEQELTERRLCRALAAFVPTAEPPDEDVVEAALAANRGCVFGLAPDGAVPGEPHRFEPHAAQARRGVLNTPRRRNRWPGPSPWASVLAARLHRMELEGAERGLLVRIYSAEQRWASGGHDDRSFILMHTGGMGRTLDHPGWDDSWPTPTSRQIDDLDEHGLLRVELHAPNHKNRTFSLSTEGRRLARTIADLPDPTPPSSPTGCEPEPGLDDVLKWLATLDADSRAEGARVLQAAVAHFDPSHLEIVSSAIFDLADDGLVRLANPMARLTGFAAATRLGKASDIRLTAAGLDRLEPSRHTPLIVNAEYIGQVAAGDITNNITINQEIIDIALAELNKRDVDAETRAGARALIDRVKVHGMEVLVAAAGTDVGALALDVIRHAARLKGLSA